MMCTSILRLLVPIALLSGCTSPTSRESSQVEPSREAKASALPACAETGEPLRALLRRPHEAPGAEELEKTCSGVEPALRDIAADRAGWGIERLRALELLATYPSTETLETAATLSRSDALASVRRAATVTLGHTAAVNLERAGSVCAAALKDDEDAFVRAAAAEALGRIATEQAISALELALKSEPSAPAREAITRSLELVRSR